MDGDVVAAAAAAGYHRPIEVEGHRRAVHLRVAAEFAKEVVCLRSLRIAEIFQHGIITLARGMIHVASIILEIRRHLA